jgi:aspartate/methionine/tyrosine aminotransferase
MGVKFKTFDVYDYRGDKLQAKLESYLSEGNICAIVYSNPNNPSWICLREEELKIIGELATKYDVVVMEDLAYFAMDFRKDLSTPFQAPYQATVARYTDNYMLLISGSKAFSYAGERIGVVCISDALFHRHFKDLAERYQGLPFGLVFSTRMLYALSSGTSHSAQYALAAMLKAAYEGKYDFRKNLSTPFQAPYQATVARYTDNYMLLISGSKAFSYAGERIGVVCISDALFHRHFPDLAARYQGLPFGLVFSTRMLYALSSGTSHSAQYALAAMFKAAYEGKYDFRKEISVYGERAKKLKEIFCRHHFYVVYDKDLDEPIADGFYFTIGYPGMTSGQLAKELMYYGVSAICLITCGSEQEGLRVCTSFIENHQYDILEERMKIFEINNPR